MSLLQHRRMNNAISEKQFRRHVVRGNRLGRCQKTATIVHDVGPAEYEIKTPAFLDRLNLNFETMRFGEIISIEKCEIVAIAHSHPTVPRPGSTVIVFEPYRLYSLVVLETLQDLPALVGRSVINTD